MSKAKKIVDEVREKNETVLEAVDKNINSFADLPGIFRLNQLTHLVLSHNKISEVPAAIAELTNLELLNLVNNYVEELAPAISSLPKLKILNLAMNGLKTLPRGFGAFPQLEVLDLTYNNLSENSLPVNFFCLETLRALYLCDNDFEVLSHEIGKLKNLQILGLRDNDLIAIPAEIGELSRLRELHIQNNRLTVLPPELGNLDLVGSKQLLRMENNPWVPLIADELVLGVSHVLDHLRTSTYESLYNRHVSSGIAPPPKKPKQKKTSIKG